MSDQKRDLRQARSAKTDKSKPYKPKTVEAGANVAGQKKAPSFQESLKTRADDPRNWEFYYEDSAAKEDPWNPRSSMGKRSLEAADRRQLALAKKKAKEGGQSLYEVKKLEFETKNIIASTEKATAVHKASRPGPGTFGSTATARNLAAQKAKGRRRSGATSGRGRGVRATATGSNVAAQRQQAQRRAGGGASRTAGAFDAAPQTRTARIS